MLQDVFMESTGEHWVHLRHKKAQPLPDFGWKIHVSCTVSSFTRCLEVVTRIADQSACSLKHIDGLTKLEALNSGQFGDTQIGKCFTLYPAHWDEAQRLLQRIRKEFNDPCAPKIPTDAYYSPEDSVALRYGQLRKSEASPSRADVRIFGEVNVPDILPESGANWLQAAHPCFIKPASICFRDEVLTIEGKLGRDAKPLWVLKNRDQQRLIGKVAYHGFGSSGSGPTFHSLLEQEWAMLQKLEPTGVVPKPLGFVERPWSRILITEHLVGDSLDRLPLAFTKIKVPEMLQLIKHLHEAGIVHLDLKLSNIFLDVSSQRLKLIDFELAQVEGQTLISSAGTPTYKSPQVVKGARVEKTMDLYAFGMILAHLCLGRDPAFLSCDADGILEITRALGYECAAGLMEQLFRPASKISYDAIAAMINDHDFFERTAPFPLSPAPAVAVPAAINLQPVDNDFTGTLGQKALSYHYARKLGSELAPIALMPWHADDENAGLTGMGGRCLAHAVLAQYNENPQNAYDHLAHCLERSFSLQRGNDTSLESGLAGFVFSAVKIGRISSHPAFVALADQAAPLLEKSLAKFIGPDGLYRGRAGILLALHGWADSVQNSEAKERYEQQISCLLNDFCRPSSSSKGIRSVPEHLHWAKGLTGVLWASAFMLPDSPDVHARWEHCVKQLLSHMKFLSPSFAYGFSGVLDTAQLLTQRVPGNPVFENFQEIVATFAIRSCLLNKRQYVSEASRLSLFYGDHILPLLHRLGQLGLGSILGDCNLKRKPCRTS